MKSKNRINRFVFFPNAPIFDPEVYTGVNNRWVYRRAPDGMLFELISVKVGMQIPIMASGYNSYSGIFAVYDGHEYTHWNQFPGVESREALVHLEMNVYNAFYDIDLHKWECKEFTIGTRSRSEEEPFICKVVVFYRLKKANKFKLLEYALKHPYRETTFKRSMAGGHMEPPKGGS